tara:strand:+ start:1044 stop:1955 length:912 start_codon:yes stop_codon:yes gene_type:complete
MTATSNVSVAAGENFLTVTLATTGSYIALFSADSGYNRLGLTFTRRKGSSGSGGLSAGAHTFTVARSNATQYFVAQTDGTFTSITKKARIKEEFTVGYRWRPTAANGDAHDATKPAFSTYEATVYELDVDVLDPNHTNHRLQIFLLKNGQLTTSADLLGYPEAATYANFAAWKADHPVGIFTQGDATIYASAAKTIGSTAGRLTSIQWAEWAEGTKQGITNGVIFAEVSVFPSEGDKLTRLRFNTDGTQITTQGSRLLTSDTNVLKEVKVIDDLQVGSNHLSAAQVTAGKEFKSTARYFRIQG